MRREIQIKLTLGFVAFLLPVRAAGQAQLSLSSAENTAIEKQIKTLRSPVERKMAGGWSDAKKVAETLCRPAALPVLKKELPGTDRFFLGTDLPATLTLESNRRLTGTGSARTPKGWEDFRFTCDLDPDTGKVAGFTVSLTTKEN